MNAVLGWAMHPERRATRDYLGQTVREACGFLREAGHFRNMACDYRGNCFLVDRRGDLVRWELGGSGEGEAIMKAGIGQGGRTGPPQREAHGEVPGVLTRPRETRHAELQACQPCRRGRPGMRGRQTFGAGASPRTHRSARRACAGQSRSVRTSQLNALIRRNRKGATAHVGFGVPAGGGCAPT